LKPAKRKEALAIPIVIKVTYIESIMQQATLYYVHDPMCSWCWGYRPEWLNLRAKLCSSVQVISVLGGLAPDNNEPMPLEMQQAIAGHWQNIQAMLGTEFNFDFWSRCQPRRDTYKACRAVVVANGLGSGEEMIEAIQRAYYLRAMNPSEPETLVQLADEIGLEKNEFRTALMSEETNAEFNRQLTQARQLGARSFPSLVLETGGHVSNITLDYQDHRVSLKEIYSLME
jgi:putative protein-disulfide isomerase